MIRQQRYDDALALLGRAIARTPGADLYDHRGVLLALLYREEEALQDYARALALAEAPTLRARIFFHRALLHGRRKSFALALQDLEQAGRLDPANALYREAMGQIRLEGAGCEYDQCP